LNDLQYHSPKSSSFLKTIFDALPNAVFILDQAGFIITTNNTADRLLGYAVDELAHRHISVCFDDPEQFSKADTKERTLVRGVKKDGHKLTGVLRMSDVGSKEEDTVYRLVIFDEMPHEKSQEMPLPERFQFERLLTELFATFINIKENEFDAKINHTLECIGQFLKTDRCHLFQLDEEKNAYVSTHSWAEKGITPLPLGVKDIQAPWIAGQLLEFKIVQFTHVDELPADAELDKELAVKYGVKSMLMFPLIADDTVIGGLMLDQVQSERTWSEDLILRLKIVADVISNLLIKRRSDKKLQQAFQEIKQLKDHIESERNYLREEIAQEHNFENIIGKSNALLQTIKKVEKVAPTESTVLILGETGTGKELIARAIHKMSLRKDAPLIKVNCASLPAALIESELFGHEKGAFTGAHARRKGRFELADGATLFLDEIGELPMEVQGKLLTVLEHGEFERVGSSHTIKVDVRIIVATNRDLEKEVHSGNFRQDLWYRLNVFSIKMPPLRQRKEDIPLLVNWMLNKLCKQLGKQIDSIPATTMKALEMYPWPGNIRELQNVIERSIINTQGNILRLADKLEVNQPELFLEGGRKTMPEVERHYIIEILKDTNWKIEGNKGAAKILGLPPSTLRARMKKHGIMRSWQ
jgi:formate hydrogenlyase transcriptional activator